MASHTHIQDPHNHNFSYQGGEYDGWYYSTSGVAMNTINFFAGTNYAGSSKTSIANKTATNQYTGGNTPFNVIQPTRAALCVIKT